MKTISSKERADVIDTRLRKLHESHDGRPLTCREISEGIGKLLTVQRIHQIEQKACRKMWRRLRREPAFEHLFQP